MKYATVFACLLLATPIVAAQQGPDSLVIGQKFVLHSNILNEDRPYWVYLPPSYESSATAGRSYPVLYLLDGLSIFRQATAIVHQLGSANSGVERIPEMIIVAPVNTNRTRDFTPTHMISGPYSQDSGSAPAFLQFMKDELIPSIESHYRALPERTLVGHSLGGLLALDAFIEQPMLFKNYIAIDPSLWWDDKVLVRRFRQQPVGKITGPITVFIALANDPTKLANADTNKWNEQHNQAIQQFRILLQKRASPELRVGFRYFEDETHLSVPLLAMYRGLLFAYDGYVTPPNAPAHVP